MQIRLAVVLSGGASLGAYQAGAVAALVRGVQARPQAERGRLVVDAVGGASAGALVALLASVSLLEGADPVALLRAAWVDRLSLGLLRGSGPAPLGFERLRPRLREFLDEAAADGREDRRQGSPLGLHVALTGLRGLTYPIREVRRDEQFPATTYTDWGRFLLEPGAGAAQLVEPEGRSPLDFVLASAAHPGAFAPRLLDRAAEADAYRRHGIADFPERGTIWYTDGGILQGKPLGRVLSAAREADERAGGAGPSRRAAVVVDPRSEGPSGSSAWTDPEHAPGWLDGLARALAILPAQILYDDARRVEKRNTRLAWRDDLVDRLAPVLGGDAEAALREVLDGIEADRRTLPREERRAPGPPGTVRELLARVVDEVAGLGTKEFVDVNVVSPALLAGEEDDEVPSLLAGEFMGDFGGFLDRDVRLSDFALGYASTRAWLASGGLADVGLDDEARAALLDAVDAGTPGDWRELNRGRARVGDLSWRSRAEAARLAAAAVAGILAETAGRPLRRRLRALRG